MPNGEAFRPPNTAARLTLPPREGPAQTRANGRRQLAGNLDQRALERAVARADGDFAARAAKVDELGQESVKVRFEVFDFAVHDAHRGNDRIAIRAREGRRKRFFFEDYYVRITHHFGIFKPGTALSAHRVFFRPGTWELEGRHVAGALYMRDRVYIECRQSINDVYRID
ncbi:hypothetical protein [Paraburkholderia solisilvae]|uniref:hypothetical protein n=1 Tax=Paraburkholderia solisilvae TaxID=624376 RepID=UPI0015813BBA|nr:hypothetical protein [Paraburkholderia solisilvae]